VQRATAVQPTFALDPASAPAVARICRRLDGLPLAIELAASRTQVLAPAEILARLESRSDLLTTGARDLPERQRTLREAIAWSHELLGPAAQRLFRRLGVFAGGFTLEMAEDVCGLEPGAQAGVLDVLGTLVENHLVERVQATGAKETPRFDMLETIREYALAQLAATGETDAMRRRHAESCVGLAERAEPELTGPQQVTWFRRLEAEAHNLRAALAWCLDTDEVELGLRLAGAVWRFWARGGHAREDGRWLEALLERVDPAPAAVRAKALNGAGCIASMRGDFARADAFLEKSLALRRQIGDTRGVSNTLANLGMLASDRGEYARARKLLQEALALWRSLDDTDGVVAALIELANVAMYDDELEKATELYEESLELGRRVGDTWARGLALGNLGLVMLYREQYARARQLVTEALELYTSVNDPRGAAWATANLGALALCEGDYASAASLLHEGLLRLHEHGDGLHVAECIDYIAHGAADMGEVARAARLLAAAEAVRNAAAYRSPRRHEVWRDRALARARASLGEEAFAAAWAEGAVLPLEGAIEEAMKLTTAESR